MLPGCEYATEVLVDIPEEPGEQSIGCEIFQCREFINELRHTHQLQV